VAFAIFHSRPELNLSLQGSNLSEITDLQRIGSLHWCLLIILRRSICSILILMWKVFLFLTRFMQRYSRVNLLRGSVGYSYSHQLAPPRHQSNLNVCSIVCDSWKIRCEFLLNFQFDETFNLVLSNTWLSQAFVAAFW